MSYILVKRKSESDKFFYLYGFVKKLGSMEIEKKGSIPHLGTEKKRALHYRTKGEAQRMAKRKDFRN